MAGCYEAHAERGLTGQHGNQDVDVLRKAIATAKLCSDKSLLIRLPFTEDVAGGYEAHAEQGLTGQNGNQDVDVFRKAVATAKPGSGKPSTDKPTLIGLLGGVTIVAHTELPFAKDLAECSEAHARQGLTVQDGDKTSKRASRQSRRPRRARTGSRSSG